MNREKLARIAAISILLLAVIAGSVAIPVKAATYSYNRQAAVNYAVSNWNNSVPGSSYFSSNDCTNFVSNALRAGGWPETLKPWTYSQHLNFRTNPKAWYADNARNWYSYTWGAANNFGKFLGTDSGRAQPWALSHQPWYQYFQIGDIVQIDFGGDGQWDHTMIVTKVDNSDMYMTYHTENRVDRSLNQIIKEVKARYPNARFMGYRLYNQFTQ